VLAHNQKLSDALQIIDKSLAIFHREDPNTERSSKVKRDVLTSVGCYLKILKERKMTASQRLLDSYKCRIKSHMPFAGINPPCQENEG
jgi:hypothetical protein